MKFRSCGRWARSRCSSADRYCSPQFVQEAKLCKDVLRPKARLTKQKLTEASKFCIQHGRASRHQIDHDPREILSRGCFSSDVKDQNGGPGTIPVPSNHKEGFMLRRNRFILASSIITLLLSV